MSMLVQHKLRYSSSLTASQALVILVRLSQLFHGFFI